MVRSLKTDQITKALETSISTLPYLEYKSILSSMNCLDSYSIVSSKRTKSLLADKTTDFNSNIRKSNIKLTDYELKTNTKYYTEAIDLLIELLTPYAASKNPPERFFDIEKIDVKEEFSTNTWLTIFRRNLEDLLNKKPEAVDQILAQSVITELELDTNIIDQKIKEFIISSLTEILKQMTSLQLKKKVSDELKINATSKFNKLLDNVLSDIQLSIKDADVNSSLIATIGANLSKALKTGTNKERDIENIRRRYQEKDKSATDIQLFGPDYQKNIGQDKKLDSIIKGIVENIKSLDKFATVDLSENEAFGDSYKSAMLLIDSLKAKQINTVKDILDIYETFNKESVTSRTFDLYNSSITKYLEQKREVGKEIEKKSINFPKDLKNQSSKEAIKVLEEKYRNPKIDLTYENTRICLIFIIAFDVLITISKQLKEVAISIPKVVSENSSQSNQSNQGRETLSIYTYKRFFDVKVEDGKFEIVDRKDDKIEEDLGYITKEFDRVLTAAPYAFCIDRLDEIQSNFNQISNNFVQTEDNYMEKSSAQLFKELGIPAEKGERLIDVFMDGINSTKTGKKVTSTILKYYNKNAFIKHTLGISGKVLFNFGKMALFFVQHGGYRSFTAGMDYLRKYPKNFLDAKLARPEECKTVYSAINKGRVKSSYLHIQKTIAIKELPVFDLLIEQYNSNKEKNSKVFRQFVESYRILTGTSAVMKVIQRLTKGTVTLGVGLNKDRITKALEFIDKIFDNRNLTNEQIIELYNKEKGGFTGKDFRTDCLISLFAKISQLYNLGAALEASSSR